MSEKDSKEVREAQRQLSAVSNDMEDFRTCYRENRSTYVARVREEAEATAHKKRKVGARAKASAVPDPAWKEKRSVSLNRPPKLWLGVSPDVLPKGGFNQRLGWLWYRGPALSVVSNSQSVRFPLA